MILVPGLILFTVFSGGFMRIHRPVHEMTIRVGLVACDTSIQYFDTENRREALDVIKAFEKRVGILAAQNAQIIVLPEKFVGVTRQYYDEITGRLKQTALSHHVMIVAGMNLIGAGTHRNVAIVFSPDGKILYDYDKVFFIPGAEKGYRHGTKPGIIHALDTQMGIQICKDLDFPEWSRRYAKADTRIMFVPAWDFTVDAWLHSRMAVMRAVENGFSLVRCAQNGFLTIADDKGKIIAENSTINKADALLIGDVCPGHGQTFYAYTGDWFAFLNLLTVIFFPILIRFRPILNE